MFFMREPNKSNLLHQKRPCICHAIDLYLKELHSYLGQDVGCADRDLLWFASVLPDMCWDNISVTPWLFLPKSFSIHQSLNWLIPAHALRIIRGFFMVQEVSCWPVRVEAWADSWTSLWGIYGGQCGSGIGLSLSTFHSPVTNTQ